MSTAIVEVKVPRLAESISEATLVEWLKGDGAAVKLDEPLATLETDKAAVEIVAAAAGVLRHARKQNETVLVGDLIATIDPAGVAAVAPAAAAPAAAAAVTAAAPPHLSPAVRRITAETGADPSAVVATGKGGRLLKEDVIRYLESPQAPQAPPAQAAAAPPFEEDALGAGERIVPMSRIRLRIAERLVQAQQSAAILTTFNEIDMSRVMETRARLKDAFEKKHGVRLGFMSFFARACVLAIADVPAINAEIRGSDIVYHDHVHLGIAATTPRGLVVPVVRHAERMDFAAIEREVAALAQRGRDGKLSPQELSGGTFTITNGGVFGSMLSTPILNPPQSGILGIHKIEKRPVVVDDQVVIRPMMYVALSYDHRLIDGEQAVTFLVRVKERLEDTERLLLVV